MTQEELARIMRDKWPADEDYDCVRDTAGFRAVIALLNS